MTPVLPPSTPVELRLRAAALGGGGRAGRDGDAVDMTTDLTSTIFSGVCKHTTSRSSRWRCVRVVSRGHRYTVCVDTGNLVNFGSVIPEFCRCVYNNNTNKHICIAP